MSQQYTYSFSCSPISLVACTWQFESFEPMLSRVIPDGCHDLIVVENRLGDARAFVSDLGETTYAVVSAGGRRYSGVRLKPGVTVDRQAVLDFLASNAPQDLLTGDRFAEFCRQSPTVSEVLACLADARRVTTVARDLGISVRTLQRVVLLGSGKPPTFWRALARARRAARALSCSNRPVDTAAMFGFSDQAHLCREMMRWFGRSPGAIKRDFALRDQLHEPGYAGGVTGEQISTRNPSGSDT